MVFRDVFWNRGSRKWFFKKVFWNQGSRKRFRDIFFRNRASRKWVFEMIFWNRGSRRRFCDTLFRNRGSRKWCSETFFEIGVLENGPPFNSLKKRVLVDWGKRMGLNFAHNLPFEENKVKIYRIKTGVCNSPKVGGGRKERQCKLRHVMENSSPSWMVSFEVFLTMKIAPRNWHDIGDSPQSIYDCRHSLSVVV